MITGFFPCTDSFGGSRSFPQSTPEHDVQGKDRQRVKPGFGKNAVGLAKAGVQPKHAVHAAKGKRQRLCVKSFGRA